MCKKNENLINNDSGNKNINPQKHNLRNEHANNNHLIQDVNGSIENGNLQNSHNLNNPEENSNFPNFGEFLQGQDDSVQTTKGNDEPTQQLTGQNSSSDAFGLELTKTLLEGGIKGLNVLSNEFIDLLPGKNPVENSQNTADSGGSSSATQGSVSAEPSTEARGSDLNDPLIDKGLDAIEGVVKQAVNIIPDNDTIKSALEDKDNSVTHVSSLAKTFFKDKNKGLVESGMDTIAKIAGDFLKFIPTNRNSQIIKPINDNEVVDDITEDDEEEEEEEGGEQSVDREGEEEELYKKADEQIGQYLGELEEELHEQLVEELYFDDLPEDEENNLEDPESEIAEREHQEDEDTEKIKPPTNYSSAHKSLIKNFKEDNEAKKEAEQKVQTLINLINDSDVADTLNNLKNDLYQFFISF